MQLRILTETADSANTGVSMSGGVMDTKMDTRRLLTPWRGWSWSDCYLQDPSGNRYSPEMVQASLWASELAHELVGTPLQVMSLKKELRKKLDVLKVMSSPPEIVIRWQGVETSVQLPKTSYNTYYVNLT